MEYNKLVSVTGLSGLFELLSSKADGGIVRSLEDKTTKFVSTRVHSFSHLESIEIFTTKDNVNLVEVFTAIQNSKEKLPDAGDAKAVKAYFEKVYPDMDFARVYNSDMKKIVKWYQQLVAHNIEIKLSEHSEEEVAAPEVVTTAKAKPAASTKAATTKAAPPKKINSPRKMA
ncbi:DUF5606 domain-containing protein [Ferruginibacter lapsinanis]|uniref:DUF5606 family protein n=1 Tax=Ferruginibacter lapsinanis TaxID=563172 RepID=UPI001E3785CE|nr:DUF5606 domain-containing protein [Ferruginibacter lapsinanis]UEG50632.1 DUF5606 domain-containing protein [Ferruginibacter lapsinanis]